MNLASALRIAQAMACCAGLSGCNISALVQPAWPSREALQRFDFRRIDADPAIRVTDQFFYYYGASYDCHFDFTGDPAFAKFDGIPAGKTSEAVGRAAWNIILAEVERQHPGYAGNADIAQGIFEERTEEKAKLGYAAPKLGGCDQMKEPARGAVLAITEFGYKLLANGGTPQPARAGQ